MMNRLQFTYARLCEKGQTLVEFALIVSLLLALLFGVMEFGRAWQYSNALTNGVRDGARFASRLDSDATYKTTVIDYTFALITSTIPKGDMTAADIDVLKNNTSITTGSDPNISSGDLVTVEASYDFDILTRNIISSFAAGDGPKVLVRRATMMHD